MSEAMTPETCPEREHHGNPFRYCPVKGCGWHEPTPQHHPLCFQSKYSPEQLAAKGLMRDQCDCRTLSLIDDAVTVDRLGRIAGSLPYPPAVSS